ncbi:MAG: outer membrane lipoprotein-sorting protein [Acidobacteria bacterium]|nr:outer membrane lipoprotein-sorting protein [Acidobacteriota bacterium]
MKKHQEEFGPPPPMSISPLTREFPRATTHATRGALAWGQYDCGSRAGHAGVALAVAESREPPGSSTQSMPSSLHGLATAVAIAVAGLTAQVPARPDAPAPAAPDVEQFLQHLDDLYRSKSSIARIQIDVAGSRGTRSMRVKAWTRGEEQVLVLIEAPPREAGTATLRVDNNLWNYLPKIARTIRVPPAAMLGSWMGTDFTNDDLVKESSLRKDFAARIDRRSDGPAGWWLVLDAKPGVVGRWARIEMLVSDERLPVEERHFDRKGRLARMMYFDEVKVLGGRRLPSHIALLPADTEGPQRTDMRYLDVQFDVALPDDTFSLSRLEQVR